MASGRVCDSDGHSNTYRDGSGAVSDTLVANYRYAEQDTDDHAFSHKNANSYSLVVTHSDSDRYSTDVDTHTYTYVNADSNPDVHCYQVGARSHRDPYATNSETHQDTHATNSEADTDTYVHAVIVYLSPKRTPAASFLRLDAAEDPLH